MNTALGYLLLCCDIGDGITPLSLHQLSCIRQRMAAAAAVETADTPLSQSELQKLGFSNATAEKISVLLSREDSLRDYLALGAQSGCYPLTCVSNGFPQVLRSKLGKHCPAVLFYRGNLSLLENPCIAVVGSRKINELGYSFARHVGQLAAAEGYTLVSGNAHGADRAAQEACLLDGGNVIAVVSEPLYSLRAPNAHILYLSEQGWHQDFSAVRALSRNRLIHALGEKSFVAQCAPASGTWKGSANALKQTGATVFFHDDGSAGASSLQALGAIPLSISNFTSIRSVLPEQTAIFDE